MSGDCLFVAAIINQEMVMRALNSDSYFRMPMGCAVPSRVIVGPR
jgi:hypothetical protein